MRFPRPVFPLLLTAALLPMVVLAHGAAERYREVAGYRVELSAETLTPQVGVPLRYNFDLFVASTSEQMEGRYDRVWVRLMQGDTLFFSTWLAKPEGLLPGFTYAFPKLGDYELTARFARGDVTLVEADFTITVTGTNGMYPSLSYLFLLSGVAFLLGVLATKRLFNTKQPR